MKRIDTWTTESGLKLPVYLDGGRVVVQTVQARRDRGVREDELTEGKAPFESFDPQSSARIIERLGYTRP